MWVLLYCCRCCCVSFSFPPVVWPGQRFGPRKAAVSVQLPSAGLHQHGAVKAEALHRTMKRSSAPVAGRSGLGFIVPVMSSVLLRENG